MAPSAAWPDDFGLDPVATLSRVGDPTPGPEHAPYWNKWLKVIDGEDRPTLTLREPGGQGAGEPDRSDATATHGFRSMGGVRIGARLLLPPRGTAIRAGLVATHGYVASQPLAASDGLYAGVLARGVAVLAVRVRGYAGSRLDVDDLTGGEGGAGWITHGLDDPDDSPAGFLAWVYPAAIADVFNACRALRARLNELAGAGAGLYLSGESFGAGLALGAAAKIPGRVDALTQVDRLVLSLPTMGDWPWRHQHPLRRGMGAEAQGVLVNAGPRAGLVAARLRAADSVLLAARVRCPSLCKLAERDDVVPAPTQSAVFNALGVDPGRKWRFIVPCGHAEAGAANARRHAEFLKASADFLDPGVTPDDAMAAWEDRLRGGAGPEAVAASLFAGHGEPGTPDHAEAQLIEAYQRAGRTLDDLPYTDEFEALYTTVAKAQNANRRAVFHRLHNLRKAGRLPRLGRPATGPVRLSPAEERRLIEMVEAAVGTLGQRDQLPFTPEFDALCQAFNAACAKDLTPHALWRLVARLAK